MSNFNFDNIESIDDLAPLDFPVFDRFSRDVRNLTESLDQASARKIVDAYYTLQENRMAFAAQTRELEKQGSPHELVALLYDGLYRMEPQVVSGDMLDLTLPRLGKRVRSVLSMQS